MGRLQSFADYPISWCCIMTSKRGWKSKSAEELAREMAKVSGLEVHPSYGKVLAKAHKGKARRLRPRPSRHGPETSTPTPLSRHTPALSEAS
jgi:hypothetical protein